MSIATKSSIPLVVGKESTLEERLKINARIDHFASFYKWEQNEYKLVPPTRATYGSLGTKVSIGLNTFDVTALPSSTAAQGIWQHDVSSFLQQDSIFLTIIQVSIGSGNEKRALIKKLWFTDEVQAVVGKGCLFDGNKLAWYVTALRFIAH